MVQFREKSLTGVSLREAFDSVADVCREGGVPLILNADLLDRFPPSAVFNGLHLNAKQVSAQEESPISPDIISRSGGLPGYSAHTLEEVKKAYSLGFQFITLSPIFETPSKQGILQPVGPDLIRRAKIQCPNLPVIALGGINPATARECINAGADGIAVMRAICSAANPKTAARELTDILRKSR